VKKFAFIIFIFVIITALFSSCSENGRRQSGGINIICTIFPQYDWVSQIIGEENADKFNLTLLLDSRVDLHSYNPSVQDMAKIKTCDVFIYVGGHSDDWTRDALSGANPDIITLNLVEILGDLIKYDDHDHDECDDDHGDEEYHIDEHVWLSIRHAKIICAEIAGMLSKIDPDNAQAYNKNLEEYILKLSDLDAEYQKAADSAGVKVLVFADRFPFLYLLEDYGIDYYSAFSGCSAETEAGFVTIISLANRINQFGLSAVMVTESSDQSIAKTVIRETNDKNQRILTLDSMQSVTSADVKKGVTYISVAENNLSVLKEALK